MLRVVVAGVLASGCTLPSDGIARLRLEPPAIEVQANLDGTAPSVHVAIYAQRYDGLEYETAGALRLLDPPASGDPLGEIDGQVFTANQVGGLGKARVIVPEGETTIDIRVDLVGTERNGLEAFYLPYFESAQPIATPSTIAPGDDTIVPLDTPMLPIHFQDLAGSSPYEVTISAPFLEAHYYGFASSETELALPHSWSRALARMRRGQDFEIRVRLLDDDLETMRVQATRVRLADRSLGRTAIAAQEFDAYVYDLGGGFASSFGFQPNLCLGCQIAHEPNLGRVTFNGGSSFEHVIADIARQTTIATSPIPWTASAFAGAGTRLVTADTLGVLTMRDGFTALPLATIDLGGDVARDPAVSPDSTRLAWFDGAGALHLADLDIVAATIANRRVLVALADNVPAVVTSGPSHPTFSADGRWILYATGDSDRGTASGFAIVAADGGTPWRISASSLELDANWTVPLGPVTAGGEVQQLTWLAVATRRGDLGFSNTGVWLWPIDPVARRAYPPFPVLDSLTSGTRHPPIFDRRPSVPSFE